MPLRTNFPLEAHAQPQLKVNDPNSNSALKFAPAAATDISGKGTDLGKNVALNIWLSHIVFEDRGIAPDPGVWPHPARCWVALRFRWLQEGVKGIQHLVRGFWHVTQVGPLGLNLHPLESGGMVWVHLGSGSVDEIHPWTEGKQGVYTQLRGPTEALRRTNTPICSPFLTMC